MKHPMFPNLIGAFLLCAMAGDASAQADASSSANRTVIPDKGIASDYPGDVGIERDARVIFVEDFEEPSLDALAKRWDTVGAKDSLSFTSEIPAGSTGDRIGNKSLEK